ncbi:homocysteine-responsive endoplasmic reticulum-resident ubiquitin-like domain member 2 protein [Panonychus citri]|uniref:homocysteine-responsive endoplasmic reticulum-resident ubiquitin-like domain member 2 protein n=1 Tax=Panonychus citri TaxID=50023 RepID=UPI002307DE0F|nr:homocysteine-responsive endoplasmic reticulum-resident ubiquitin-like domain member 2 protein [Panonychus citri]
MDDKEINNNNENDVSTAHQQLFSQATLAGLFSGYPFVLPNNYPWTNFVVPTETGNPSLSTPSIDISSLLGGGSGGVTMSMDQITQNVAWMSYLFQFQMFQQMYAQYLAQHMSQPASLSTLSSTQLPDACLLDGHLPLNPPMDQAAAAAAAAPSATVPPQGNNNNNINNNVIDAAAPVQEPIVGAARLEPAVPAAGVRLAPAPAVAPVEEDEDFVQRDWIDWLSLITRAVALASFIYLYASFGRFMLVTVLYFLYRLMTSVVEAYNAFLAIGAPRQAAAPVPPQPPAAGAADQQQNNHGANNNNNNINNNVNNNQNDGPNHLQQVMDGNIDDHHANNNNNPLAGEQQSSNEQTKIRLFFAMVKALFSSLIPLQTQPL